MKIEKGDGLVIKISMDCNCDCNKKRNEDDLKNETVDKEGVLDLISSFEEYIVDVNRYAKLTPKKAEIANASGTIIDVIDEYTKENL